MDDKVFLRGYELIQEKLAGLEVKRAFNSIGSNIFFDFGEETEVVFKNGKKSKKRDWTIWISRASWKITKEGKYIVGSGDSRISMESKIQQLLGKRFQSLQFRSQFLDTAFNFEEGYQLTTFFNHVVEDQWTVFLPDGTNIGADCSNEEELKNGQTIAKQLVVTESYTKLEFPKNEVVVTKIKYNKDEQPTFHFDDNTSISFANCTWRLEKGEEYLIGYLDDDCSKTVDNMLRLIGKKLLRVKIADNLMDAIFLFEDQYVLKTFTCGHATKQWGIFAKSVPLFQVTI